jgi:hypothetical protein
MSSPTDVFDPYLEWLGIDPRELPADHYRLLGLPRFESNAGIIMAAADGRMALIRSNQTGPRGAFTNALLNEITAAKLCLLSPVAKAQYDKFLHEQRSAAGSSRAPAPFIPTAVPLRALPIAVPLAPPKQTRTLELALDVETQPSADETPRESSRVRNVGVMAVAILLIAGGIWGAGQYFVPPIERPDSLANQPAGSSSGQGGGERPTETFSDPAAKATVVGQEGSGELNLPPSAAALVGATSLKIDISENVLGGWTSADDAAIWKFKLLRPGFFQLELGYAAAYEGDDRSLELLLDEEEPREFQLTPTGGIDKAQVAALTVVIKASGTHTLGIRPTSAVPEGSLLIKSLRLIPVDRQP